MRESLRLVRASLRPPRAARGGALARALSIADLRAHARRRLPRMLFDHLEGGAWDELTAHANEADLRRVRLTPRALVDVTEVDLSRTLLGMALRAPVVLAPTGLSALFHPDAETAVASAAADAGVAYTLSTMSSRSIEQVAAAAPSGVRWFQVYVYRDRGLLREFVERCRAAGYGALCLTVDVPVLGSRDRDRRSGMTIPPRFGPLALAEAALHPAWLRGHLGGKEVTMANVADHPGARRAATTTMAEYMAHQLDPAVTWADVELLREWWDGPLLIKGVLRPADARRAVEAGCDAVIVSNHGGRQLDRAPSAAAALPGVVAELAGAAPVLLDGGVRRGIDVAAALALGASAVMLGRPYLYGLAAGGRDGVARALEILEAELRLALRLLGVPALDGLGPDLLTPDPVEWTTR